MGSGFYKNFQSPELLPLLWKQLQNTCTLACKTQIRFEKLETYIIDLIDRPAGEIRVRLWSNCSICRTNREEHPEDLLFLLLHEWKSYPNAGLFTLFEVLSSSLYWRPTLLVPGRRLSITRICLRTLKKSAASWCFLGRKVQRCSAVRLLWGKGTRSSHCKLIHLSSKSMQIDVTSVAPAFASLLELSTGAAPESQSGQEAHCCPSSAKRIRHLDWLNWIVRCKH